LVKSKRVGLITNPSGIDRHRRSLIDLFIQNPLIDLVALYGPEHGIRGKAQAGEFIPYLTDKTYGLPVYSLYGQSQKPGPEWNGRIDERMRSFDTVQTGKLLEPAMIEDVDVIIYDIQDVGTRIYTYIATMAYCMQACAEAGLEFIVLDRPNPINGKDMEGPILDYPRYSSFVGLYPIPIRHAMTSGELARMFNEKYLMKRTNLTVIPMQGWARNMWFDETGLPWISPSPNMPTLKTATIYPGQVFLEGTNISEGRGTDTPFELFGAPWIDGLELTKSLNGLHLPGVRFEPAAFTPVFSKYRGELCEGSRIQIEDRSVFKPLMTTLYILKAILEKYAGHFAFHDDYFDKIMGNSEVRHRLLQGQSISEIVGTYDPQLDQFGALRKPYLLY